MIIPDWLSDLHFAFSHRGDGQMSFKHADKDVVLESRNRFFHDKGLNLDSVVTGELAHGAEVALVTEADAGRGARDRNWIEGIDGLVTDKPGILLMTTHADCAPLVIYDKAHKILGQAHAGWRGLASGLIESLVERLKSLNGTGPSELHAWIGPTIRACCYEVDRDVADRFPDHCRFLAGESIRLDLTMFVHRELWRLGLNPDYVTDSNVCTSCNPEFSSYRRVGLNTQAMACITGIPE